ncbi:MAG: hypothetical protein KDA59_12545 [Planctomycetales bacterium]|nr:hypothetical protein [Planctomycetales bacterium]
MAVADLPVTILSDDELIGLGGHTVSTIRRLIPDHPWFAPLVDDVERQIADMNVATGRDPASGFAENVAAADEARDAAYLELRATVEYRTVVGTAEQLNAAGRLQAMIRRREYSLHSLANQRQSVETKALLQDLSSTPVQADLTTLNLSAVVEQLRTTQSAFDSLIEQREASEEVKRTSTPSVRLARALLRDDLATIRQSLVTAQRLFAPQFDTLAGELSQHITNAVATARARITRKENQTAASEPADAPA